MMKKYFFIAGLFLSVWGQNAMAQKIDTKGKGEPFFFLQLRCSRKNAGRKILSVLRNCNKRN